MSAIFLEGLADFEDYVVPISADCLTLGCSFDDVRAAAIDAGLCIEVVALQCNRLAATGRQLVEPPDYATAYLPSTNARTAMLKARQRYREAFEDFNTARGFETCVAGHPWTPENIYIAPNGNRQCRKCCAESHRFAKSRNQFRDDLRQQDGQVA